MVYAYVIESLSAKTWYTGIALDPIKRLKEHNGGKNRFTKGDRPWKVIFTEEHSEWQAARVREKYLKSAADKKWLVKYLSFHSGDTGSLLYYFCLSFITNAHFFK
ncbi:MAG: GIY-YIG nuclease family protein [Chitinophagaceae bacterium]|nr:GIY-YIG nuclease family protein [Chitinophagaceae bacterium]